MENIVVKGEIAHFEQFNIFSQCFPKAFSFYVLKLVFIEERLKENGMLVWQSLYLKLGFYMIHVFLYVPVM